MAIEVYVPADGLQGQSIPGHVLWSDERVNAVRIRASPEFVELEAFNVDPDGATRDGNVWTLSRFQRTGYVGFVLKTQRTEALDSAASVELVISTEGAEHSYTKPVRLFRPALSMEQPPTIIRVDGEGRPSNAIRLHHEGHGTLFVTVSTLEDSVVKTVIPEELLHAVKGFAEDFQKGLEELKPKYPDYPHIFEPFTKEDLQDREAIGRRLAEVIEEIGANVDLAGDIQVLFTRSLLQNSDFESMFFAPLLDFFSSIVAGGTILSMPWLEFDVPAGRSTLNLVVEAKDLLGKEVVNWKLPPIAIESAQETILPLSQLVVWPKPSGRPKPRPATSRSRSAARPTERRRGLG